VGGGMSASEIDATFVAQASQAFALGLSRAPLPAATLALVGAGRPDAASNSTALKVMALAGQAERFRRPAVPKTFDPVVAIADTRRIIPDAARRILKALQLRVGSPEALAIADRFEAGGWRPHPFDLPELAGFLETYAERLGPTAMAFVAGREDAGDGPADYFADVLDETNWTSGTPARRAEFIARLRVSDPAKARGLVEAALPGQTAAVRLRLLAALRAGLSADDLPFLESLAGDRAPTVKALAAELAGHVPGGRSFETAIEDAVSRLRVTTSGARDKTVKVTAVYPADIRNWQRLSWAFGRIGGLPLDELAKRLGISVDDLTMGAAGDPDLAAALLRRAIVECRFALVAALIGAGADLWPALAPGEDADLAVLRDEAAAGAFIAAALRPGMWTELPSGCEPERLYVLLRRALPPDVGQEIMAHDGWRKPPPAGDERFRAGLAEALVPLLDPRSRKELRRVLEEAQWLIDRRALQLIDLHDLLERT